MDMTTWNSRSLRCAHARSATATMRIAAAVLAALLAFACGTALAGDKYWQVTSGNWSVPANWNGGEPSSSDDAYIQNAGTAYITAGNAEYADDLYISSSSALEISGGSLNMGNSGSRQYIGYAAGTRGTVLHTGGSNTLGYNMYLGDGVGSQGYYTMSGTGASLYVDDSLYAGYDGIGVFQQSAGSVSVNRLRLGNNSGSSGTYRLSGTGTLTVRSSTYGIDVGTQDGYGRFEWFRKDGIDASKINMGGLGTLAIGYNFSSVPSIVKDLDQATLEVTNNATVTKTNDGVTSSVKYLRIGSSTGAGYGLQTGGTVQVGQTAWIGDGGTGVATQSAGTFTTTVHLYMGINGGDGTYRLKGGTLNVNSNIFGGSGTSTLILDGGTLSHGGTYLGYIASGQDWRITNLKLGDEAGRTGSYTLGSGKQMNVVDQYLGVAGAGSFTQSGGSASVTNLRFGTEGSGVGTYLLTDGTLNVGGQVYDGPGAGTLQIDGGTLNPSGAVAVDNLKVGITAAGSHTQNANAYNVGTLTLGSATYRLTGGTLNAGGVANTTGTGTLNLDGGTFMPSGNVNVDNLGLGIASAGSHTQTGQTYTVGTLTLGAGTYTLSGGTLAVTGNVANGTGTGTLALDGGTFSPSGSVNVDNLHVGVNAAASHTLAGGTWQAGALTFGVTAGGSGTLTLAGGTLNVTGNIGTGPGSGTLILNGGALGLGGGLAVTDLKVGVDAAASHTQSSKTYDIAGNLAVGSGSGIGTYRLEQTGQLQVGEKVQIGHGGGTGRFEWYRAGGLSAGGGIEVGSGSTLAMGSSFDADTLAGAGGLVSGLDNATLEVTRGAAAAHNAGAVSIKALHLGGSDGGGTYRLLDDGELTISSAGRLAVGTPSAYGRLDWHRAGGLNTPRLVLGSGGTLSMGFDFGVAELFDGSLFGGTLIGMETATLEITGGATATQAGGAAKAGTLAIGAGGQAGTYEIPSGNLHTGSLQIGMGGPGLLDLGVAADVSVSRELVFGPKAALSAEPGSRIKLIGTDVLNYSMDAPSLADLLNLTLAFQPEGGGAILSRLEVAGEDRGVTMAGFEDNFALDTLIVGATGGGVHAHLLLVDEFLNQGLVPDPPEEALYVRNIYVHPDATLDLNFLNVYYDGVLVNDGMIIKGMPHYIPEPATLALLALGGLAVLSRRRRGKWASLK